MRLLRYALTVDAAACGGMGIALAAAAGGLDGLLGVPAGWLVGTGVALTACAAGLGLLARVAVPPAGAVRAVVAGNLAWAAAGVVVVAVDGWPLTTLGTVVVLAQAAAVLLLAGVEWHGLRSARRAAHRGGPVSPAHPGEAVSPAHPGGAVSAAGRSRSVGSPAPGPR